jgi:DNA-binding beta-propeller fold protein YncE
VDGWALVVARRSPLPGLDIAAVTCPQTEFPTHGRPQGPQPFPTPLTPQRETCRLTIFSFLLLLSLIRIRADKSTVRTINRPLHAVSDILGKYSYCFCFLFMLLLLVGLLSPTAHADGGAPQLAYVAGTAQGISVIDIARRRVTGSISIGGSPRTVLLSPDGHALYATEPTSGRVAVINAKTGKPLCTASLPGQPSVLALSLDAAVLYAAGQGDTRVRALDPGNCAVQQTFETHEPVYGLAVTASTAANATPLTPNQLWITGSTGLTIFDVNGHLLGSVPIAGGPQDISIPGGFTAYVTTRQGTVVAVDLGTRQIIRTLLSGGQFGPMDYDANTGEVYVPDRQHNQLDVLEPVTAGTTVMPPEPGRIIRLSSSPQSVAITSDGQLGFVALSNGRVLMLDIPGRSIVTSIAVGGTPHFIITGLYPPVYSPRSTPQQTATSSSPAKPISLLLIITWMVLAGILLLGTLWLFWRYYQKRLTGQRSARKRL